MTDRAIQAAHRVLKLCRSRDPIRIAKDLGVEVMLRSDFEKQKGAFCVVLGQSFIILNDKLNDEELSLVCAHELGHALLHRAEAEKGVLCEYDLFNMATAMEYEANVFASELLIDPQEMNELFKSGLDIYGAARALSVNVNLLIIKLAELNRRGGKYHLPYLPYRDFIGGNA